MADCEFSPTGPALWSGLDHMNDNPSSPSPPSSDGPPPSQQPVSSPSDDLDMTGDSPVLLPDDAEVPPEEPTIQDQVKTLLVGKALDLGDRRVYQHLSLAAFFAWVGLGADGLSSSCYGPAEAFEHLEGHEYLAIFLAFATMFTVVVISACYSHIIEAFPSGGGGYLVASKMLGRKVGALAGCALVVDYVLTVTVSIAAAGDALFGLLGLVDVPAHRSQRAWSPAIIGNRGKSGPKQPRSCFWWCSTCGASRNRSRS